MKVNWFLGEAVTSLKRNWEISLAAIYNVALSLLIVGVFSLVILTLNQFITRLESQVEIEAFLVDGASFTTVQALQDRIISWAEVKDVKYISKEEALERFKQLYKDQPDMWKNLSGNPLPASYQITLKNPRDVEKVASRLRKEPVVESLDYGQQIVKRLFTVTSTLRMVGLVFILLQGFVSVSLIGLTIRLAIYARRNEVAIMRLVGASNWFIRLPFLLEGMLQGVIGALVAILVIYFLKIGFFESVTQQLKFLKITFNSTLFLKVSFGLLLGGMAIGAFGSTLSLRRYLRV